jgi:hypothetical protein
MRKILLSLISVVALGSLVACGSGSSSNTIAVPANPSGGIAVGFTNGNLSGAYVFAVHGTTPNSNFAATGVFTADGNGAIVSGTRDIVDDQGNQILGESISGTYAVNGDGRGQAVLNGNSGQAIYRFVLSSPTAGKLFQDGTGTKSVAIDAVGTIQQQSAFAAPAGTYIVRLDGEDTAGNVYGTIGGITISGTSITGSVDENDDGTFTPGFSSTGTLTLAGTRGTATLTTPTEPSGGHSFIVYYVSATHIELVSTDRNFFLYGHADLQVSPSLNAAAWIATSPNQVFSLAGFDQNGSRVDTGRFTLDTTGTLDSAVEDINNQSNYFPDVSLTGSSFAFDGNGRWTANLVNALPVAGVSTPVLVGWQISPQESVVLTTNTNILETGTLQAQTLGLATANVTGSYAQAFAGFNSSIQSDLELIGNINADGLGGLSGTFDEQTDSSGLLLDASTTGNYVIDPTLGRSSANLDGGAVVIYTVNANTLSVISAQQFDIYQGTLVTQLP